MTKLWAKIDPNRTEPRILITDSRSKPLVKARLSRPPQDRRALPALLEAIASWEGQRVRAALVVDGQDPHVYSRYHDCLVDACETPLYSIDYVPSLAVARRLHKDCIRGMGRFHDLRQLTLFEVGES